MATLQMERVKQDTSTWSSIFPLEQKTREQSLLFVKKLVALGVSSITYLRGIFPESAYGDKDLDGLKLKMLLDSSSCRSSNMVVAWMKGCFEAIENQYLRLLTFAVYGDPNKPDVALETYTFKFRYTQDGRTELSGLGVNDLTFDVRKSTKNMLRSIILLTQTLKGLPKKLHLAMKLGYYDDVTPADYEPPGFKEGGHESFMYDKGPVTIRAGDVMTFFHTVKLRAVVDRNYFYSDENSEGNNVQDEVQEDKNSPDVMTSEQRHEDVDVTVVVSPVRSLANRPHHHISSLVAGTPGSKSDLPSDMLQDSALLSQSLPLTSSAPHWKADSRGRKSSQEDQLVPYVSTQELRLSDSSQEVNKSSTQELKLTSDGSQEADMRAQVPPTLSATAGFVSETSCGQQTLASTSATEEESFPVKCPCGADVDDGLMILCDLCSKWQHAVCFNISEGTVPDCHVCHLCATPNNPSTDPTLVDHPQVMMLCLYRRTLSFLHENHHGRLSPALLAQQLDTNITAGKQLLDQLLKDKLIKPKKKFFYAIHQKVVDYISSQNQARPQQQRVTQTPSCSVSDAGYDGDVTPDLEFVSFRNSFRITGSKSKSPRRPLLPPLDESISGLSDTQENLTNSSQDVTVGTQGVMLTIPNGLEVVGENDNSEAISEALATAGMTTQESVTTPPSLSSLRDLALHDLHMDEDEQESLTGSSTLRRATRSQRSSHFTSLPLSRGKRTLVPNPKTMSVNDFDISMSQDSEIQEKRSRWSVVDNLEVTVTQEEDFTLLCQESSEVNCD